MAPFTGPLALSSWKNAGVWEAAPPATPRLPRATTCRPSGLSTLWGQPVWQGGNHNEDELLANCYRNSLALAEQYSIKTMAFPAISTGVYSFPLERASRIAVSEVKSFLERNSSLEKVVLVCFSERDYRCYVDTVQEIMKVP
jgi:O-acetyl-ADP-ribose deacetylase (regulator of RNase III)